MRDFYNTMNKAVFIDFDGTLMNSELGIIPESTLEALRLLNANGHLVVIATGRNLKLLEHYPDQLGIDHVVGSNGRFVSIQNKTVYQNPIPKNILIPIIEDLNKLKIDYTLSTDLKYFTHQKYSSLIDSFSNHFKMPKATIEFDNKSLENIYQLNIFTEKEIPSIIVENYPLIFTRASKQAYDVTHGIQLKETGIKFIADKYQIKSQDIIAIGDGLNDIGMIQYAGLGIAMGNAKQELKNVADYVTDSIDKDGFLKALKAFNLI
jgi:Cof subfamily protein (haloacid dehalogenase superfamily)